MQLMTRREIAAFLRVSTSTIDRWTNAGRLPVVEIGAGPGRRGVRRWRADAIVDEPPDNEPDDDTRADTREAEIKIAHLRRRASK